MSNLIKNPANGGNPLLENIKKAKDIKIVGDASETALLRFCQIVRDTEPYR